MNDLIKQGNKDVGISVLRRGDDDTTPSAGHPDEAHPWRGGSDAAKLRVMKPRAARAFTSTLFRVPGKGGWVFAPVPPEAAPAVTLGWGRTPVRAIVDDTAWDTSVWREKSGRTLLAVPAKVRGDKDHGDEVQVRLEYDLEYLG